MEAFMYRMHPQWQLARRLVGEGQIGQLRTIQTFFSYFNVNPENIRNIADDGGGGMLDIGCYCISISRFIFGGEPRRVVGIVEYDPKLKTDRLASAMLDFPGGTATFTCSTQLSPYQRANILGTEGRIEVEIPFNAPSDKPCRMWHQRGTETQQHTLEVCDQYSIQGDLFSQAILENKEVPTPLDDAWLTCRVIEAVFEALKAVAGSSAKTARKQSLQWAPPASTCPFSEHAVAETACFRTRGFRIVLRRLIQHGLAGGWFRRSGRFRRCDLLLDAWLRLLRPAGPVRPPVAPP